MPAVVTSKWGLTAPLAQSSLSGTDDPFCTASLRGDPNSSEGAVVKWGLTAPLFAPFWAEAQMRHAASPGYCASWQVLHPTQGRLRRRSPQRRRFRRTRSLVLRVALSRRSPRRRAPVRLRRVQLGLRRRSFLLLHSVNRWQPRLAARLVPFIHQAWGLVPARLDTCGQPRRLRPGQPRLLRLPLQLLVPLLPTRRAVHQPLSRPPLGQIRLSYPNFDLDHRLSRCRSSSGVSIGRTRPRHQFPHPAQTAMPFQSRH